jgi:DNA repair protein RecO (recombination protein O)
VAAAAPVETEAVVVRLVDYGESDRVVTLVTRTCGKVAAMARGARKSRRRFGPGMGLYVIGQARLRERHGSELLLCDSFVATSDPTLLATDLARLAHASYLCELVRELLPTAHAEPEVFELLCAGLGVLADPARPARAETLRGFEIALLDALGLGPILDRCAVCGGDVATGEVTFDFARGGVVCAHCPALGPVIGQAARLALAQARSLGPVGAHALALAAGVNAECRDVLLSAVHHHLGRSLRSLEFIAKVSAGNGARGTR